MNFEETKYGFNWGCAVVERHMSDEKRGWVLMGIKTPKANLQIYVTKTGKIRVYNYLTGTELLENGG